MQTSHSTFLEVSQIKSSPTNPRKTSDISALQELAESIRQVGILQPIMVRPVNGHHEIVCGERRYKASIMAGLEKVPVTTCNYTDDEVLDVQIIENLQRKDVHPLEESASYVYLHQTKGLSFDEISKRVGKSASYVTMRAKLDSLSLNFKEAMRNGKMTLATAVNLSRLPVEQQDHMWDDRNFENNENIEVQVDSWLYRQYTNDLTNACFDITDPEVSGFAPACTVCPNNSAFNTSLFPDIATKAICSDSACFTLKGKFHFDRVFAKHNDDPSVVLICSDYNSMSADAQEYADKGFKVYSRDQFNSINMPKEPVIGDLDEEDFESQEELESSLAQSLNEYQQDIAQYMENSESPDSLRGLYVDGDKKGKMTFIKLSPSDQKTPKGGASAKNFADKMKNNSASIQDMKAEIYRLELSIARKLEIDEEKMLPEAYELLVPVKDYADLEQPLGQEELVALIIVLCECSYATREHIFKSLVLENIMPEVRTQGDLLSIFHALKGCDNYTLSYKLSQATRYAIYDKLYHPGTRPSNNGSSAALSSVINVTTDQYQELVDKYSGIALARTAKFQERINTLQAKIPEEQPVVKKDKKAKNQKAA